MSRSAERCSLEVTISTALKEISMPLFHGARPAAPLRRLLLASAVALGAGAASLGHAVPAAAATNVG